MVPLAHPSPQPKQHLEQFSRFCTAQGRESLYFTMAFPLKLPLPIGDLNPHLTHDSVDPRESSTQMASQSVQPFLQGWLLWQSDHTAHSVTLGHICIHSTAMWPKNGSHEQCWSVLLHLFQGGNPFDGVVSYPEARTWYDQPMYPVSLPIHKIAKARQRL